MLSIAVVAKVGVGGGALTDAKADGILDSEAVIGGGGEKMLADAKADDGPNGKDVGCAEARLPDGGKEDRLAIGGEDRLLNPDGTSGGSENGTMPNGEDESNKLDTGGRNGNDDMPVPIDGNEGNGLVSCGIGMEVGGGVPVPIDGNEGNGLVSCGIGMEVGGGVPVPMPEDNEGNGLVSCGIGMEVGGGVPMLSDVDVGMLPSPDGVSDGKGGRPGIGPIALNGVTVPVGPGPILVFFNARVGLISVSVRNVSNG